MLFPELEESLRLAQTALDKATSENIIEICKEYLALLAAYRAQLFELPHPQGIDPPTGSSSSGEEIEATRREIRVAIERTTRARNRITALLRSFTAISAYEAVETLNRLKYEGHEDWELKASGVRFGCGTDADRISIQEAVSIASLLRREEYITRNVAVARV